MREDEKVKQFNQNLDAILSGQSLSKDDPALDLVRMLAQVDLSPRSRRRLELRHRFQFRRVQPVRLSRLDWTSRILRLLAQTIPTSWLFASVLLLVFLPFFLAVWSPISGASPVSARGSQTAWLSPQPIPIPTPYAPPLRPSGAASPAPAFHTDTPALIELPPTQIYTRQPQRTSWLLPDKKP